jgi:unsaturated chondroitin disaccharide hydrolase
MANYFIENLPADHVPYWDFNAGVDSSIRDSSAAAIAASALWMLSELQTVQAEKEKFSASSINIINSLMSTDYFNHQQNYPALLLHATGNKPGEKEVDTSLIYADYYFIEALLMQQNNTFLPI